MNWSILGIEPTKDKKAITAAYRQRLRTTNPEDKPEEFKALRAAYEEALALADKQDAPQPADDTPVGRWIAKVESVYGDLSARINSNIWRGLLSDGVCVGLDTRLEAEDALLKLLMKSYYLPKAVWQLIEETFHFAERLEELKERYPANFLETVICGGLKWDPSLPFELFIPGKNGEVCDRYISLYMEASQLLCGQREELLEQLNALSERHPYGDVMRFRESIANGDREAGTEGLRQLTVEYPDDSHILVSLASVFVEEEKVEEAEALCLRALQAVPGCAPAKMFLSRCKSQQGAYDEAKELLIELLRECGGDPIVMEYYMKQLKELNEQLIPQREARMAEEPEDADNLLELAWCYFQNGREADAVEIAGRISADCEDSYKYHNLMGKLQFNQLNYAEALEHLQLLEAVIRQLPDDGTAETRKRRERLPEVIQLQGTCLMQMGENAQAREKLKEALALAPDDLDNIQIMGKVLYAAGEHEYAVEILERANALSPSNWHINLLKALSLFRLYRDRDAYDAISVGISSQVKDMSLYLIKLQILLRNQVWNEVHETLEMLEASGVEDDLSLDFVKAQLTELEQKDEKAAFAQYQKIARRVEAGENILWGSILYYRMACLMSESMDMDREEDRELLMVMLDKGLA